MARKFIVGVELLTGLSIGSAAAAAAVSFITAFLVFKDLDAQTDHMATVMAFSIASSVENEGDAVRFIETVEPLIHSGDIQAVTLMDGEGQLIAEAGATSLGATSEEDPGDWKFYSSPSGELTVALVPHTDPLRSIYGALMAGLAVITAVLVVLALSTPRFLAKRVITPLRSILIEADRFTSGSGTSIESAGSSFHRLVQLLHQRDRQLNQLREKAERRAERVEERAAAIMSILGSSVVALDPQGRLILFNHQAQECFSLTEDDRNSQFPWDRSCLGRMLKARMSSEQEDRLPESDFQIRVEDGGRETVYSVQISRSEAMETALLVTDVTRVGELERRIADQTAMADIGAASAGISHEMGNTLCALSGFVDLLTRGHSDERTMHILSEVRREVESAQRLISSFGSFARSPEPESRVLSAEDIEELCREACEASGVRFSIDVLDRNMRIRCDGNLLGSCIRNIVRNAGEADPQCTVSISAGKSGNSAFITVGDDGPGIEMDINDIFRPFRTTKGRDGGNMGLGLAVSRRILRVMGGDLTGENGSSGGAVFRLTLPAVEED